MSYRPQASPYGDIYSFGTKATDTISQRLYAEQQKQEADQRKSLSDLDNEFGKDVAGVRAADMDDLTKAYGDYKAARIDQIKRENLKKESLTPQEQLGVLQKKAAVYKLINDSKAQKEAEKSTAQDITKNHIKYTKDAPDQLQGILKTPVSKFGDANPFDGLLYKGNMTDFNKLLSDANGKPQPLSDEVVDNPDLKRKEVTKVTRLNNPIEYYNSLRTGLAGQQKSDDFIRTFGNITPEELQNTELKYNQAMADPTFRRRLGMTDQDLPPIDGLTDAEKTARYLSMLHTLSPNVVTLKEGAPIYDKVAIMNEQQKNKIAMAGINDAYIRGRMQLKKDLGLDPNSVDPGNPIDETDGVKFNVPGTGVLGIGGKTGSINKGVVVDDNGRPITSANITIPTEGLPAMALTLLRHNKIFPSKTVQVKVENGDIQSIDAGNGGIVTRQDMLNFGKKYDTERKGESLKFSSTTPKPATAKPSVKSKWGKYITN